MKRQKKQRRSVSIEHLENRIVFSASSVNPLLDSLISQYSVDGTGNNLANPTWGSTGIDLLRMVAAEYADGLSAPAGDATRPSARVISNTVADQGNEDIISDRFLSAMIYAWGQFIDHDIDLTLNADPAEPFNIDVPEGDAYFDPHGEIPLNRSAYDPATGTTNARQQVNSITAWLDGSMIYGSDVATANSLRTFSGGRMKTSEGNLLPVANPSDPVEGQMFLAGDIRANENVELTALQTLFVREHNYWARKISKADPTLSDEDIFQRARSVVIAELQAITYNQWLPAILGSGALDAYNGYDPSVNPGIANEFSTAAFRFGHSLLGDDVEFLDNRGLPIGEEVPLSGAFFNPDLIREFGIDSVLKYLASDPSSELDTKVVSSVRNFLFGAPGSGGLDLASLNIQRGRDHGLADYNSVRAAYGLPKVTSFAQITSDKELQAKLEALYGTVDNIDLWVGGLAEDHVEGASVGPTLRAIIADQFERLRDGDRYWYQNVFSGQMLKQIEKTTLADVLRRNTVLTNLQGDVFFFQFAIAGKVLAQPNRNGRDGGRQQPVAGIQVELVNREGNEIIASTTTNSRGLYRFDVADGLRTGRYQIRVVLPEGSRVPFVASRTIAVTKGGEIRRNVDLTLPGSKQNSSQPRPRNSAGQHPPGRNGNKPVNMGAVDQTMARFGAMQTANSSQRRAESHAPSAQRLSREEVDRVMASTSDSSQQRFEEEQADSNSRVRNVVPSDRSRVAANGRRRGEQGDVEQELLDQPLNGNVRRNSARTS